MNPVIYILLATFILGVIFSVYEGYVYHRDLEKRLRNRRLPSDEYRKKRNRKR